MISKLLRRPRHPESGSKFDSRVAGRLIAVTLYKNKSNFGFHPDFHLLSNFYLSSSVCWVVVMMLPAFQSVLTNHTTDLHVDLVIDGMAEFNLLIVDSMATVREATWLSR